MKNIILCFLNVLLMSTGQIVFKYGMKGKEITSVVDIIKAMFSPVIFSGIILYGLTTMLWLYILSRMPLSVAYPIQALAFPIVLLLSVFVFRESIPANKWMGIAIVVVGLFVASR